MSTFVENAVLNPGTCYFCGSGRGPFVDTGRDDDDGRMPSGDGMISVAITHVYICAQCAISHAQLVAARAPVPVTIISTHLFEDLKQSIMDHAARARAVEGQLADAEAALRFATSLQPAAEEPEPPARKTRTKASA